MEPIEALSLLSEVHELSSARKYQEVVRVLGRLDPDEFITEPELAIHLLTAQLYLYLTDEGLSLSGVLLTKEQELPQAQFANRIRVVRSGHLTRIGALQEAQECLERCLTTCRWDTPNRYTADVWNNLGIVYSMRGEWDTAISALRRSLGMYQQLGLRLGIASACHNIGMANRYWGHFEEAERFFRRAATYYYREGTIQEVTASEAELSLAIVGQGDVNVARAMARRAVRRCIALENQPLLGETLRVLGTVLRCAGAFTEAKDNLLKAYRMGNEQNNEQLRAETCLELGLLSYAIDDIRAGERYLAAASRIFTSMQAYGYVRRVASVRRQADIVKLGGVEPCRDTPDKS